MSELGENASAGKANVNGTDKLVLGAIAQLEDILSDDENDSSKPGNNLIIYFQFYVININVFNNLF